MSSGTVHSIWSFQFHKGTIRTFLNLLYITSNIANFNSIKVRLEQKIPNLRAKIKKNFNSIKVRLELSEMFTTSWARSRFQFHKGTIRTHSQDHNNKYHRHFNSIKVRLEHSRAFLWGNRKQGFQFHKGTIRTVGSRLACFGLCPFQFHKGTIRTVSRYR